LGPEVKTRERKVWSRWDEMGRRIGRRAGFHRHGLMKKDERSEFLVSVVKTLQLTIFPRLLLYN